MPKKKAWGRRDTYERLWRSEHLVRAGGILLARRGALEAAMNRKVSAQEMAAKIGVDQSTVSRYENGEIAPRDYPTASAVADVYQLNPEEREEYFQLIFGLTEEKLLDHLGRTTAILRPERFEPIFNSLIVEALWEKPSDAVQQAKFYGDLLETVVKTSGRSHYGQSLEPLAGMARLIEAFGTGLSQPAELDAAIKLAKHMLDRYGKNIDVYVMGNLSVFTLERMKARTALYIDEAEAIVPQLRTCNPFIAGIFCEGLAKQYTLSPEHTIKHTTAMTTVGRAHLLRAGQEQWLVRFDEIEARATFLQHNDPRNGATQMHEVIEKLHMFGKGSINIYILALGYEATMRLHAGEVPERAAALFRQGYRLAKAEGIGYFMKAIQENAGRFGIAVEEDELS